MRNASGNQGCLFALFTQCLLTVVKKGKVISCETREYPQLSILVL